MSDARARPNSSPGKAGAASTYANPIIPGFYPDPSVCRVGGDYYLVTSTFEYFPAVPIFHSRDLVNWRQIGNVLDRPSQLALPADVPASGGIYAPTIRHHDGRFWMITTDVTHFGRHLIVTATDPAGPWSDPVYVPAPDIDPSLAWEDDGTCWMTTSGVRNYRIDPGSGEVIEGPVPMWSGTGGHAPEAPHLYRIGDWWYLLIAEGGTHLGHAVSVARARTARGPFEPAPANPILTHRGTGRPVQATGHADLVEALDGSWWMFLLGTRPQGRHPRYHVLGRETFLVPVRWVDGWPVAGPVELEGTTAPAAMTVRPSWGPGLDDFDGLRLGPEWISPRSRPDESWSLTDRPGWLTLHATGTSLDQAGATIVGRRQQHHDCRASAHLDAGPAGRAGLTIRIDEAHHYEVEVAGGVASVIARIGPLRGVVAERPVPEGPITIAISTRRADAEPDTIAFEVQVAGEPVTLAELDGRYLSTEVAAGFTGRVIGMYVTEGSAAFDRFEYYPAP